VKITYLLSSVLFFGASTTANGQFTSLAPNFCDSFSKSATASCESFKDLFNHHDREIIPMLPIESSDVTYACFDETEDRFLLMFFVLPQTSSSSFTQDEYRSGIRYSDHHHVDLEWHRPLGSEDYTYPEGWWIPLEGKSTRKYAAPDGTVATADASEISVHHSFLNKSGDTTDYKLEMRRSTRRFIETWQPSTGRLIEQTGKCAEFSKFGVNK